MADKQSAIPEKHRHITGRKHPPWKPGESGNPKGRPPGPLVSDIVRRTLDSRMPGSKETYREAFARALVIHGIKGKAEYAKLTIDAELDRHLKREAPAPAVTVQVGVGVSVNIAEAHERAQRIAAILMSCGALPAPGPGPVAVTAPAPTNGTAGGNGVGPVG